jgi:hypothetical protein
MTTQNIPISEQIFNSYDEAHKYRLTIPWKLETCNAGESCWCRIILPTEKIFYKNQSDGEIVQEFEYIIPDGSVDKETAEYLVKLHNDTLNTKVKITTHIEFRCNSCYKTIDSYFYRDFCKACYDKGVR